MSLTNYTPDAKDQEIFSEAMKRSGDPDLTKPFVGYVLRARIDKENETAVILLCSPNGKEGIIEDVTCTTRPDMHRPSGSPCEYLLDVKRVCVPLESGFVNDSIGNNQRICL